MKSFISKHEEIEGILEGLGELLAKPILFLVIRWSGHVEVQP